MNVTRQFFVPPVHDSLFLSVKASRTSPPLPVHPSHSISSDMLISSSIILSHSASSANSTGTLIQQQKSPRNRSVDLPSPTSEAVHECEAESDSNQTVQLPSQSSDDGTAGWILVSRTPRSPKKHVDAQFMAHMARVWRQNTNSTSLTPRDSLMLCASDTLLSATFSQSLSVASLPPVVEFPPTPVFKDEIPEGIMERIKVNSARL